MPTSLRGRQSITFAVLAVSVSSFALLQSLIVPVLARIQIEFDTDQTTVTWVLTAYLLSASICTPLLGRVGDVVGKKRMLVVTLSALAVGSLAAALAPSIGWLIAARVVQGAGGGVLPLAFGIIRDEFDKDRVTAALSVIASLTAVGFGAGIVIAGPIVDGLGYHWLFWLPMIATALAAAAALLFVPESPVRTPGRLPVLPAVLLSVWLVALLLALSEGNSWGWASPRILGLLAVAVLVAAAWVRVETRVPVPMIDMKMMRLRGIWTTNLVAAFVGFGMFASFGFLPQFLQTPASAGYGFGASISESGRLLLPSAVASFLVGFWTARLIHVFGARLVIVTGTLLNAVAFASMALFHDVTWQLYAATTIQGVGSGPGVLQPRRRRDRVGAPRADRRRERHERQHPDHRRLHRLRGHGRHRDRPHRVDRAPRRGRLHHRVRDPGCGDDPRRGRGRDDPRPARPADHGTARGRRERRAGLRPRRAPRLTVRNTRPTRVLLTPWRSRGPWRPRGPATSPS